jgi:hypothetical protein
MAFKFSTGFANALLSDRATGISFLQGVALALVDGGDGVVDTITHSGNGFVSAGFQPGMRLFLKGADTADNDTAVSLVSPSAVVAGTMTIPTATVDTAETFLATTTLIGMKGGSYADVLMNGTLHLYSGSQPADADAAETGTKLMEITAASGAFVSGAGDNGLQFELTASDGELEKLATQVWSGVGLAAAGNGTVAGWWRVYANTVVTGSSTSAIRIDGSCSMTSYQMRMSSTTIVSGATVTVDTFKIIQPLA